MLSAWEQGKDLGSVLGLESAIAGTWAAEKPQTTPIADARRLIADEVAFDRLVGSGLIRIEDDDAIVVRPKLIEAFNDIREYGVSIDKLIDVHEQVLPLSTGSAPSWCRPAPSTCSTGSNPAYRCPTTPRSPS